MDGSHQLIRSHARPARFVAQQVDRVAAESVAGAQAVLRERLPQREHCVLTGKPAVGTLFGHRLLRLIEDAPNLARSALRPAVTGITLSSV